MLRGRLAFSITHFGLDGLVIRTVSEAMTLALFGILTAASFVEPFGSMDAQTRLLMQGLLLSVWERHHQTVLFITHDIEEALLIADSVSVMTARPGRIKKRPVVNLPRPRSVDVTMSPVFNELKREVLTLIREESVRTASEGLA